MRLIRARNRLVKPVQARANQSSGETRGLAIRPSGWRCTSRWPSSTDRAIPARAKPTGIRLPRERRSWPAGGGSSGRGVLDGVIGLRMRSIAYVSAHCGQY
ncbi:hypothetical protein D3C81_1750520 [compost metagenome]